MEVFNTILSQYLARRHYLAIHCLSKCCQQIKTTNQLNEYQPKGNSHKERVIAAHWNREKRLGEFDGRSQFIYIHMAEWTALDSMRWNSISMGNGKQLYSNRTEANLPKSNLENEVNLKNAKHNSNITMKNYRSSLKHPFSLTSEIDLPRNSPLRKINDFLNQAFEPHAKCLVFFIRYLVIILVFSFGISFCIYIIEEAAETTIRGCIKFKLVLDDCVLSFLGN